MPRRRYDASRWTPRRRSKSVHWPGVARTASRRSPADHDLPPDATVTPVGISLPALEELFLYGSTSKVPSDCLVACLVRWWEVVHDRFAHLTTLVINLDHGPENHRRRTQCMRRIVDFAQDSGLTVRLASSPPYYRKYNPIERCWGILENHGHGALLDSIEAVIRFAATMTWQGRRPIVALVTTTSQTGVKLTKDAMKMVEAQIQRLPGLDKWFVDIVPTSSTIQAP
jgi:Rhodopirellula transposase DDE domain